LSRLCYKRKIVIFAVWYS